MSNIFFESPGGPPFSQKLMFALAMDEETGYYNDLSGNGNIATKICTVAPAVMPTQGSGQAGYAAQFVAASDNYATIPNSEFLRLGNTDWTYVYRVCLDSKPAGAGIAGKTEFFTTYQGGGTDRWRLRYVAGVNNTIDYTGALPVIGTWVTIRIGRRKASNQVFMQVDKNPIEWATAQGVSIPDTSPWYIAKNAAGAGTSFDGLMAHATLWKRLLSNQEWNQIVDSQTCYPFVMTNGIKLLKPTSYQLYQRNGSNQANITIKGSYTGSPTAIEVRYKGGSWTTLDAAPANGRFSGTLANQAVGQGTLEVRFTNDTNCITSSDFVGVGDLFLIMGQSNVAGRVTQAQVFSPTAGVYASTFASDYKWHLGTDSLNNTLGAQDTGGGSTAGSIWTPLLTNLVANASVPYGFLSFGISGVSITTFQPAATHTDNTTNYGQAINRALAAGGVKGVLWYQGETDAQAAMSQATYNGYLDTIADAINADLGVKFMPTKLPHLDAAGYTTINAAIAEAWGDNPNVLTGPDLSGINITTGAGGDGLHIKTNADAATAAGLWSTAILAATW